MQTTNDNTHDRPVVACDLGGTRIKVGVVAGQAVQSRRTLPARSTEGLTPRLPELATVIRELCEEAGCAVQDCAGLAMAAPFIVDAREAKVLATVGKYEDTLDMNLPAWSRDTLGLRFVIENDARAAAIGEWQAGAGRGCDDLVMVTLGTGIGCSAIIEGRALRGKHAQAGILGGHTAVPGTPRDCLCGARGCAEAQSGSARLPEIARELCGDEAAAKLPDYEAVFSLAAAGDVDALRVREHALDVWGAHAVNMIHAFDPERVIYGGGILASHATIIPAIQNYVDLYACTPWGLVDVCVGACGDDAALLAAPYLLHEHN